MKKVTLFILLSLFFIKNGNSQSINLQEYFVNGFYRFNNQVEINKNDFFNDYKIQLGLNENDSLKIVDDEIESTGKFHTRYRQYHKGYLVESSMISLHGSGNLVNYVGGSLIKNLNVETNGIMTEAAALNYALDYIGADEYSWQVINPPLPDSLRPDTITEVIDSFDTYPVGELLIAKAEYGDDIPNFLCYKFEIESVTPFQKTYRVYVNAIDGSIVKAFDPSNYYGSGKVTTPYNSSQTFEIKRSCPVCRWVLEDSRGFKTTSKAYDLKTDQPIHDWDGNYDDYGSKIRAASAHWAAEKSYDFFKNIMGIVTTQPEFRIEMDSYNVTSYILKKHTNKITQKTTIYDRIYIGLKYTNPESVDMVGHEFTHSQVYFSSKLGDDNTSYDREANILNEGFADIFGLMIDREVKSYCDWKVGDDISDIHATRNFQHPNLDVNATTNGPSSEKYHDQNWISNINASNNEYYTNGGVLRRWFFLLAIGDASNGLTGIGIDKARRIAFNTFKWWLWHNCTYTDASNASFAAAEYTYGSCSPEAMAVNDAWALVGLGIQLPVPDVSAAIISAPSPLCSNNLNIAVPITLKAISSDPRATFTWNTVYNLSAAPYGKGGSYLNITNFNGYSPTYISVTSTACQQTSVPYLVPLPWSYCGTANRLATKTNKNIPQAYINNTIEKKELFIYPNPASSEIQLLVSPDDIGKQFQIYNHLGQLMFSDKVNSLNLKINVTALANGLYLLNILSEKGISQSKFEVSK